MTKEEISKMLAMVSEMDRRVVLTVPLVEMWSAVLPGHIDAEVGWEAVLAHYRVSTAPVLPAHVIEHATAILAERAFEPVGLSREELALCDAAGIAWEEYKDRKDEPGWIEHLRAKAGIES